MNNPFSAGWRPIHGWLSLQLLEAMAGKSDVVECCFVSSDVTSAPYFATPVLLGKQGVEKNLGLGKLSDYETKKLDEVGSLGSSHTGLSTDLFICNWCRYFLSL